ncbi:MAG: hypothetical protein Q8N94_04245 [Methanoregula sp.]|nr:hypothetical protein [Methanoregula sp.]
MSEHDSTDLHVSKKILAQLYFAGSTGLLQWAIPQSKSGPTPFKHQTLGYFTPYDLFFVGSPLSNVIYSYITKIIS